MTDWTDGEQLHADDFADWIEGLIANRSGRLDGEHDTALDTMHRRIYRWRHESIKGIIDVGTADAIVVELGMHLSEIPDELWVQNGNGAAVNGNGGAPVNGNGVSPDEPPKVRGGWTRPDRRGSRYTEPQLRALHLLHVRDGRSINSLARETYETAGYGSVGSACSAISREWKRIGLPATDRIEQVRKTCTVHGMAPKHGPRRGYMRYKRTHGIGAQGAEGYQPRCAGVRTQPPRKGEPCQRPAVRGSDFCAQHDPAKQEKLAEHLARVRARWAKREMVPLEPLMFWLRHRYGELGTWKAVSEAIGLSASSAHNYARGVACRNGGPRLPIDEIGRETVERILFEDGTASFADLYG